MNTYEHALSEVARRPIRRNLGLCDNAKLALRFMGIRGRAAGFDDWLREQYKRWPEFSGNPVFPVPHRALSPKDAYLDDPCLWPDAGMRPDTLAYCQARLRLLDFLIEQAREQGV